MLDASSRRWRCAWHWARARSPAAAARTTRRANEAADQLAEQIAESGAGDDADVDIDSETGQVDVSTEDGDMSFGEGTELPEDFPADIPLPQDYELTSAMSTDTGDATGWTISGELPDADDSTFDDLVAEFTSAGWTKTSDATQRGRRRHVRHGDARRRDLAGRALGAGRRAGHARLVQLPGLLGRLNPSSGRLR